MKGHYEIHDSEHSKICSRDNVKDQISCDIFEIIKTLIGDCDEDDNHHDNCHKS